MAKRGTPEHSKTLHLARLIKMPPYAALGLLEAIWHRVAKFNPTGALTAQDIEDCAYLLRFEGELGAVLVESRWLDVLNDGRFYVHDWHDHADDTTRKYLAANGLNFANGAPPFFKRREKNNSRETLEVCEKDSRKVPNESSLPMPMPMPMPMPKEENKLGDHRTESNSLEEQVAVKSLSASPDLTFGVSEQGESRPTPVGDIAVAVLNGARASPNGNGHEKGLGYVRSVVAVTGDAAFGRGRHKARILSIAASAHGRRALDDLIEHIAKDSQPKLAAARGNEVVASPAKLMSAELVKIEGALPALRSPPSG